MLIDKIFNCSNNKNLLINDIIIDLYRNFSVPKNFHHQNYLDYDLKLPNNRNMSY
jgi:hypothetical protein